MPRFLHHPLVRDAAGGKLNKRDRAAGLREMRARGLTPVEVLGEAAYRAGLVGEPRPVGASEAAALVSTALAQIRNAG
jgi:glutamyl/glutaminyl-tRNA synthetase